MATRQEMNNIYRNIGEIVYYAIICVIFFTFGWAVCLTILAVNWLFYSGNQDNQPTKGIYSDI